MRSPFPRLLSFQPARLFSTPHSHSPSPSPSPSTMPRLNPVSQKAIDRLRAYRPPPTSYDLVPLSRRAAVLMLLYADAKGDLRVVLTIRAKTLSSYAGQAALPGGRADTLTETPFQTARREASEEIGLPSSNQSLPSPFLVEHLCELPANLARTELVVRPCVALLHSFNESTGESADPEVALIPRLDAREVAAVFTAPVRGFLSVRDDEGGGDPEDWYQGLWTEWHRSNWRMHQFFVPIRRAPIKPHSSSPTPQQRETLSALEEHQRAADQVPRYRVFGMTARMLVDVARVAYDEEPEFEHNSHFGDEGLIARLREMGRLSEGRRRGDRLTREDVEMAERVGFGGSKF